MAVAVYVRVSTEEQRERQSIETQREFAIKFCDLHSLTIYEIYADDGFSGTIPVEKRCGARRLLEDARRSKFDQILVFKLDRIGRDTSLILAVVNELRDRGIRVRSMTEEFDSGTSSGYLMLTMLSGFATHEREVIRERSVAGTNRLAEAGAWMGGVVPYGYRKEGEGAQRRIVVNEQPIPGFNLSEAEVIRTIYRMSGVEKQSCQKIADFLNRQGLPCGSAENGKRRARTASVWRPSHIRNMIISPTYKGQHLFGKRSMHKSRKPIIRAVPAIVAAEIWEKAQRVLAANRIEASRNTRQSYLLKGLIKCGLCGLRFSGMRISTQKDHYYRCNGRQQARGLYGSGGKKCPSRTLNGDYVERLVWADIEAFLRNPGEVMERLRERFSANEGERVSEQKRRQSLNSQLQQKAAERERVLGLFRRGKIDDDTLDRQLDDVEKETAGLRKEIDVIQKQLDAADTRAQIQTAESLLARLRVRLAEPVCPEVKRRLIEILVEKVEANTIVRWGVEQSEVIVSYRFGQPEEPAALVLPRSHRLHHHQRPPEELNTIGDHLRRRRLVLKLLQRQVAQQLGVGKDSVANWEVNRTAPGLQYMPAIIRFLGYDPLPPAKGWAERLVRCRTVLGISQKAAAVEIGVDQATLARWERGQREPQGDFTERASHFVDRVERAGNSALRTA